MATSQSFHPSESSHDPEKALSERERRDQGASRASEPLGSALYAVQGTRLFRFDGPQRLEVRVDWSRTALLSATPLTDQAASPSSRSSFWRTSDGSTTGFAR